MRRFLAFGLILSLACTGARSQRTDVRQAGHAGSDSIQVINGDTMHVLDADDWEVLSARRDARATFGEFVRRFREPPTTQSDLSVEVRLVKATGVAGDSAVEHVWLQPLTVTDSSVRGIIVNTLSDLRRVKYGDTISAPNADVSDWYAVDRDTLVGGFTIRLFRNRLAQAARDSEDRHRPYVIVGDR